MTDEPYLKNKTDVLDLVISFLMEHEKQMDQTTRRLEMIVETLSKRGRGIEYPPTPRYTEETRPDSFTITINNPNSFEELRSLKIEWGPKGGDRVDAEMDANRIVRETEHAIGED